MGFSLQTESEAQNTEQKQSTDGMSDRGGVDMVEGRHVKPMLQHWVSGGREPPQESSGRRHTQRITAHTSAHVGQTATGSGETQDHGGMAHLRVELPEVDRSGF